VEWRGRSFSLLSFLPTFFPRTRMVKASRQTRTCIPRNTYKHWGTGMRGVMLGDQEERKGKESEAILLFVGTGRGTLSHPPCMCMEHSLLRSFNTRTGQGRAGMKNARRFFSFVCASTHARTYLRWIDSAVTKPGLTWRVWARLASTVFPRSSAGVFFFSLQAVFFLTF